MFELNGADILTSRIGYLIFSETVSDDIVTSGGGMGMDSWGYIRSPADLGRFLASARAEQGLTQQALADELGVSRRYLSEIENGKPGLYTERLFQAMRLLGVRLRAEREAP
jgi:DNA-binding XRE family transcriptional regulator